MAEPKVTIDLSTMRITRMSRTLIFSVPLLFCSLVHAAPPELPPIDVVVTNDNTMPLPVEIQSPRLVTCFWHQGSANSSDPFTGLGSAGLLENVQCPSGVSQIDVKRIAVSNVVDQFSSALKFQAVVGYFDENSADVFDPAGILAILTDGAPIADVLQDFRLDTNDASRKLYFRIMGSSGIADQPASISNFVFFSGTLVQ